MYHFSKKLPVTFEEAIPLVKTALQQEGLGVLTEIDVQAAFQKKLDRSFHRYLILGACHPHVAYDMLQIDDKAGVMYPCNVVVQEHTDGVVEVSAVDPLVMFLMVHSPQAKEIALKASAMMQRVIASLPSREG